MSHVLQRIKGAICKADNIIVHKKDQAHHDQPLYVVVKGLAGTNLPHFDRVLR